ncbi:phosphotransferase [Planotetraspora sp. A-T 1434]|uniref:phosphotransferase family protein n=1 Tax=Planotetraspora sp. A-T 1434 TaxID=2979219 RepID=UPI0021C0E799|nr:phosphotransferase [Planotetraspora sp. A-T 1434]MCT9934211.1 phosphotransferase [Planotetraspora sp. A-T 1434]
MLVDDLVRLARRDGPVTVLKDTRVLVVRVGDVVVKAHPADTDEKELRARLDVASRVPGVMLAPLGLDRLGDRLVTIWPAGEALTPALLDSGATPWEEGGRLLARLHAHPAPSGMPPAGGPGRLARAMAELGGIEQESAAAQGAAEPDSLAPGTAEPDSPTHGIAQPDMPPRGTAHPNKPAHTTAEPDSPAPEARELDRGEQGTGRLGGDKQGAGASHTGKYGGEGDSDELGGVDAVAIIRKAYETLPLLTPPVARPALTHGDWHLGQLVRHEGTWLLIDPDDLGVGDPAWDLARPAAWFAAGLLEPAAWDRFLSAYLRAGGAAVPYDDPWRELDLPARALTVQLAATAVVTARRAGDALDDVALALVSSCGRILAAAGESRRQA